VRQLREPNTPKRRRPKPVKAEVENPSFAWHFTKRTAKAVGIVVAAGVAGVYIVAFLLSIVVIIDWHDGSFAGGMEPSQSDYRYALTLMIGSTTGLTVWATTWWYKRLRSQWEDMNEFRALVVKESQPGRDSYDDPWA
jgi:hypothetical protein